MKLDIQKSTLKIGKGQLVAIAVILVTAIGLGAAIWGTGSNKTGSSAVHADGGHADKAGHKDEKERGADANKPKKGPHGGRLFNADGYGLELAIFEKATEPQFRIYTYQNDKPTDPCQTKATTSLMIAPPILA